MNILEYQKEAARTYPKLDRLYLDVLHMNLGISTEKGELLDIFKKNIAYGKPMDLVNLAEELADVSWYVVNKARMLGILLCNLKPRNRSKYLFAGWETKFVVDHIVERNWHKMHEMNVLYDLINLATFFEIDYFKALDNNIAKLRQRYPERFDASLALNRDLEAERKILEQ